MQVMHQNTSWVNGKTLSEDYVLWFHYIEKYELSRERLRGITRVNSQKGLHFDFDFVVEDNM